jgi:hypothetical protein
VAVSDTALLAILIGLSTGIILAAIKHYSRGKK